MRTGSMVGHGRTARAAGRPAASGGYLLAVLALPALLAIAAQPAQAVVDLRISSVAYGVPLPGPVAGDVVPLLVTVVNDGNETSGSFRVDMWENRATEPDNPATSDQGTVVNSLAPGVANAVTVRFDVLYADPGRFTFWAWADSLDDIDEPDEVNNLYGALIDVAEAAPDLIIEDLTISDDTPTAGATVTLTVVVKNQGRLASGPFSLATWNDRATEPTSSAGADNVADIANLAPGASTSFPYEVTYDTGTRTFWALVDPADTVDEILEDNNVAGLQFDVTAAGGNGNGDGDGEPPPGQDTPRGPCGIGADVTNVLAFHALAFLGLSWAKWGTPVVGRRRRN